MADAEIPTQYQAHIAAKRKGRTTSTVRPKSNSKKEGSAALTSKTKRKPRFKINVKPRSDKTPETLLLEHVGATDHPEIAVKYLAFLGLERPLSKPPLSDQVACDVVASSCIDDLRKHLKGRECQVGVQVSRLAVLDAHSAVISALVVQRGHSFVKRSGFDAVSLTRVCAVPNDSAAGFGLALDQVTICWGDSLGRRLLATVNRGRKPEGFEHSCPRIFDSDDSAWEDYARKMMFAPPLDSLPVDDRAALKPGSFDERAEPGRRALITLMARSQLPVAKALVGFGQGKTIVELAKTRLKASTKARCNEAPEIIAPEEVLHFWFGELPRLGVNDVVVPMIKRN